MSKIKVMGLCGLLVGFAIASSASGMAEFKKAFEEKYVKNHQNKEFQGIAKKEACNICHVKGEKKDVRNAYGNALAELIEGEAQERIKSAADKPAEKEKILKELEEAFGKVEAKKVKESDASSPTYGDLIKQGKLPAAE